MNPNESNENELNKNQPPEADKTTAEQPDPDNMAIKGEADPSQTNEATADEETTQTEETTDSEASNPTNKKSPAAFKGWHVALLVLITAAGTYTATNAAITGRLPWQIGSGQGVLSASDFRQLEKTYELLETNFFGDVKHDTVMGGALNGMAQSLGDPYTSYYVDEENDELKSATEGKFEGIGAQIQAQNKQIVVISPIKDSPADKAGIKSGDILLKADDQSLEDKTAEEAVKLLRGKANTKVKVTIKRSDQTQELTLTRAEIPIETVSGSIDKTNKEVGVIQISSFAENTATEFQQTVEQLLKDGAKRFILDLRGNPGGLLTSAIDLATLFLKDGDTIVKVVDKAGNQESYTAKHDQNHQFTVAEPTTVLVNEGSASASEILAGALQQSAHKKIVGTKTYGKGTVQTVIPYDNNKDKQLKITTAHWLTPNGTWINKNGITPDETVDLPDYANLLVIDSTKTYKQGDKDSAIANIQRILVALDVLDERNVNGQFDEATKQAVTTFQNDHDLSATGEIDANTATQLTKVLQAKITANDTQLQKAISTVTNE
ncbi:MAG: S41 family peptidase [Aerococcus sp.]|nr:S41 family peptidase [Aerococcus sp.]